MKLYWADYHQDTRHLTRDEHGAYFLLLGEAWNRGGYLPDDDVLLARWALATADEWTRLKPIVMAYFRPATRGRWRHKRVSEELASYDDVSRKRKAAGKRGGSAKHGKHDENSEANATAIAKQKPTKPEPEPEPEVREDLFVASDEPMATDRGEPWERDPEFGRLWGAAPPLMRKRAKSKAKVWPEWQRATKRALPSAIVAGFIRYKALDGDLARTGGPGLHIWLKDRTWEQWAPAGSDERLGTDWPESRWRVAVDLWVRERCWDDRLGPLPGEPGCRVAPAIQREFGVEPAAPLPVRGAA